MVPYLGDFAEDASVLMPFNTFTSDDPSASATITNLADADVKVHKDGNATPLVTDGATVAIDFASITGNHLVTVDTSAHADYSTGSDYHVRIEGTTVDGATVNAWVGHFSIQNRYTRGTDSAALASALATAQTDLDTLTGTDGATLATTQGNYAPAKAGDSMALTAAAVDAVWDETMTAHATADSAAVHLKDTLADVTGINGDAMRGTDSAALASVCTESRLAELDAANLPADVAAVKAETALIVADTNELQTDDVPGLIAALNDPTAAAVADAVWDEDATGHQAGGTFGQAIGDPGANTETMYDALITDAAGTNVAVDLIATAGLVTVVDTVVDAILDMLDDPRSEPGQGAPAVNPDAMTKIDYLYKAWRNKKDNDGSTTNLYADDATTVDHKQSTSESGGTVTKGEWVTGP